MRLLIASLLTVMTAAPGAVFAGPGDHDHDDDNDNVTLEQVPKVVRETIEREVKNGKILEIERDRVGNQEFYEVEFMEGDKRYELDVADDGKVLRAKRRD